MIAVEMLIVMILGNDDDVVGDGDNDNDGDDEVD